MFDKSIVNGASEGLDLLERIIEIIKKIFASLLGLGTKTEDDSEK